MWPKVAPPAKIVNKNVSLTQSSKPSVKTTKDTSKGAPYKVVSTNNSVKKKPSAPIGPIRIQIPVPKMDPAELKAKTDAILKDTAETEAAEKAAAAELLEQEKLIKLNDEESLKAEQDFENEKIRDSKASSRISVNEENVVTDLNIEDNDEIISSKQIKSIEPLTSSSHSNVEHPVSHVLPIQSVAEPSKLLVIFILDHAHNILCVLLIFAIHVKPKHLTLYIFYHLALNRVAKKPGKSCNFKQISLEKQ